ESSKNKLGGEEQLCLAGESVRRGPVVLDFENYVVHSPSVTGVSSGFQVADEYSRRNSTNRGPVVLDFENSVVHLPSVMGVSSGYQVVDDVDMLVSQNNYPPNVDCPDSSLFGDTHCIQSNAVIEEVATDVRPKRNDEQGYYRKMIRFSSVIY
ncbi:hypothetical protein Tco_1307667, partial [Tanacetum coccineum]